MNYFIDVFDLIGSSFKDWIMIRIKVSEIISVLNIPGGLPGAKSLLRTADYEEERNKIIKWLAENTTNHWTVVNYLDPTDSKMVIGFKSNNDAFLCKLTFG